MTPAGAILARLEAAGLHLKVEGVNLVARPREAVTDELRALMRAHKADLLAVLGECSLLDPAVEARRQRVVEMLDANPALRLAVVCDAEGDPVPLAVAIRGKGTCEVLIPAVRFDPFKLLDLVARHGGMVH